jgi:hypothetical protein
MDDVRLTIHNNLVVTIYEFNRECSLDLNLIECIEKYYKNSRIKIREIVIEKTNLTMSEIKLISILKQNNTQVIGLGDVILDNGYDELFEAQILIPYRARYPNTFRKEQLHKFLKNINDYFSKVHPTLRYKLIIIEQNNDYMFNRGLLLNLGFLEREKNVDYRIKYYVHHNCDLFPNIDQEPKLDYSFTPINEVRDIFGYSGGIGGIAIFNRLTFLQIYGFPNDYFNWGGEDITLHKRCEKNSIDIKRPLYNVGVKEESHTRDSSFNDINGKKGERDTPEVNGLQTCKYKYKINNETEFDYDHVIHYMADFDYI